MTVLTVSCGQRRRGPGLVFQTLKTHHKVLQISFVKYEAMLFCADAWNCLENKD